MSIVVAIGDRRDLEGLALVGVRVLGASTPQPCLDAWSSLDADVGMVVLGADAAEAIGARRHDRPDVLTVVIP